MKRATSFQKRLVMFTWCRICSAFLLAVGIGASLVAAESPLITTDGFSVPQAGHRFNFPRDHGAHLDFRLEWWYLTGHAFAADGRRFGFQATFFRQAAPDRTTQLYLAHMAVIDVQTGQFLHQERLNRGGWDAVSSVTTLDVRNGPWSLHFTDPAKETIEVRGGIRSEVGFDFTLTPKKPLVRFGDGGFSRKGDEPTAASYYLTFPRLALAGELTLGAASPLKVTGEAWMDHEISSSQLGSDQVGWDWVSLQFHGEPQRELMLYRLRGRDGTTDPASTLQWVTAESRVTPEPFTWEVLSQWQSPTTKAVYPARIRLTTTDPATGASVRYTLEPLAKDQELSGRVGGIAYWEGACRILDEAGKEVGSAYMELTGYASELKL